MKAWATMDDRQAAHLQGLLKTLPPSAANRALRKALTKAARILRKAVKDATPVDEGLLRSAVAMKIGVRRGRGFAIVGADADRLRRDAQSAGRPPNIDHLVEFGHLTPSGTMTAPSGHMRRAAVQTMPAAGRTLADQLEREIDAEFAKAKA